MKAIAVIALTVVLSVALVEGGQYYYLVSSEWRNEKCDGEPHWAAPIALNVCTGGQDHSESWSLSNNNQQIDHVWCESVGKCACSNVEHFQPNKCHADKRRHGSMQFKVIGPLNTLTVITGAIYGRHDCSGHPEFNGTDVGEVCVNGEIASCSMNPGNITITDYHDKQHCSGTIEFQRSMQTGVCDDVFGRSAIYNCVTYS